MSEDATVQSSSLLTRCLRVRLLSFVLVSTMPENYGYTFIKIELLADRLVFPINAVPNNSIISVCFLQTKGKSMNVKK